MLDSRARAISKSVVTKPNGPLASMPTDVGLEADLPSTRSMRTLGLDSAASQVCSARTRSTVLSLARSTMNL